jgi:hypothetical protein
MRRGIVHGGLGLAAVMGCLQGCGSGPLNGQQSKTTQELAVQSNATCAQQSQASFPASGAGDLAFGPLRFVGLKPIKGWTEEDLRENSFYKSQALLRPGHTATVSIDPAARRFARLSYVHRQTDPDKPVFATLPHTVRFDACNANRAASRASGKPVTFWSGFFKVTEIHRCIPLTIRIDREPVRHWRLPVGVDSCPKT